MKIGIVTYIKDDNYGEELQAFAMQYYLNTKGYDAEVIDLEKRVKDLYSSKDAIIPGILNRFKVYGWKAPYYIALKIIDSLEKKKSEKKNQEYKKKAHQVFVDFFRKYTKHSSKYYTLDEIRVTNELGYDTYIAGSDQIWNYMHTDFLDVFFLDFTKKFNARRISYAASISVPKIPRDMEETYRNLVANIEYLSVRELQGAKLLEDVTGMKAVVVLDPTFLLTKDDWEKTVAINSMEDSHYVMVYTLSRSKYMKKLAWEIADDLKCHSVVFVVGNETIISDGENEKSIIIGPSEWVGLMSGAEYVVTDSFHGTAFSINFNKPFTTLVNPASNMNSRVMSILEITNLKSRIIYDDGKNQMPESLDVDYTSVNKTISDWKKKSELFLNKALS